MKHGQWACDPLAELRQDLCAVAFHMRKTMALLLTAVALPAAGEYLKASMQDRQASHCIAADARLGRHAESPKVAGGQLLPAYHCQKGNFLCPSLMTAFPAVNSSSRCQLDKLP